MTADAVSVPLARHRVSVLLHAHGWDDKGIDEAALLTTELATNAVEHAGTPFTLVAEVTAQTLRVGIRDACTASPVAGAAVSATTIGGRGLALVAAFADRWGYEPDADGKSVWFETRCPSPRTG
jgi:anti-sigma regulatory factor (Ser/Thr protein kinase)